MLKMSVEIKEGDLVIDITDYSDVPGLECEQPKIGIVVYVIPVFEESSLKYDPGTPDIVEVLMEDGSLQEFEDYELEVISEVHGI